MRRIRVSQTEFILDEKDYSALGHAIVLVQNILDEMETKEYNYCEIEGQEWSKTSLECLISDLREIYEGQITLR